MRFRAVDCRCLWKTSDAHPTDETDLSLNQDARGYRKLFEFPTAASSNSTHRHDAGMVTRCPRRADGESSPLSQRQKRPTCDLSPASVPWGPPMTGCVPVSGWRRGLHGDPPSRLAPAVSRRTRPGQYRAPWVPSTSDIRRLMRAFEALARCRPGTAL